MQKTNTNTNTIQINKSTNFTLLYLPPFINLPFFNLFFAVICFLCFTLDFQLLPSLHVPTHVRPHVPQPTPPRYPPFKPRTHLLPLTLRCRTPSPPAGSLSPCVSLIVTLMLNGFFAHTFLLTFWFD